MGQQQSAPQPLDQQQNANQEATWWCKLLARGVGAIGGVVAMIFGVWAAISIKPICIVAGLLQILLGFFVLVLETPCCCQWFDIAKPISDFAERRPFLQKAIVYGILAIIPIAMCFGIATLIGSGLVFAAGVLYGLMGLGRKADRQEMAQRAAGATPRQADDTKTNLIENEGDPTAFPSSISTQR